MMLNFSQLFETLVNSQGMVIAVTVFALLWIIQKVVDKAFTRNWRSDISEELVILEKLKSDCHHFKSEQQMIEDHIKSTIAGEMLSASDKAANIFSTYPVTIIILPSLLLYVFYLILDDKLSSGDNLKVLLALFAVCLVISRLIDIIIIRVRYAVLPIVRISLDQLISQYKITARLKQKVKEGEKGHTQYIAQLNELSLQINSIHHDTRLKTDLEECRRCLKRIKGWITLCNNASNIIAESIKAQMEIVESNKRGDPINALIKHYQVKSIHYMEEYLKQNSQVKKISERIVSQLMEILDEAQSESEEL